MRLVFVIFIISLAISCSSTSGKTADTDTVSDSEIVLTGDAAENLVDSADNFYIDAADGAVSDDPAEDFNDSSITDDITDNAVEEDPMTDADSFQPLTEETKVIPVEGGQFDFLDAKVRMIFASGWYSAPAKVTVTEVSANKDYKISSEAQRFYKHVKTGVLGGSVLKLSGDNVLVELKEGDFLRLNNPLFENSYYFGSIAAPTVLGVRPKLMAACANSMLSITSQKVWQFEEMVIVDICMDVYESSLAPIGNLGNADQSAGWAIGCESSGTCGDGSTTALVSSTTGVIPLSGISWYQAAALCQNSGKKICPELYWRVACEGVYDPNNSEQRPCVYGVGAEGCYNYRQDMCHLKDNQTARKTEYNTKKYDCSQAYKYCTKAQSVCDSDYTACLAAADTYYNLIFNTEFFATCKSAFSISDMLGNLSEFVAYYNSDDTVETGVFRGGSYVDGDSATAAGLKCRAEDGVGGRMLPSSVSPVTGVRCCVY